MPATELPIAAPVSKRPILDEPKASFDAWLAERRQPTMRRAQIRKQILANRATTFEEMTDLPKGLRRELDEAFTIFSTAVHKHLIASDDTHKLLLNLSDGGQIECVLIQDQGRATACVSTQVGCGMGCVFCASGLNGVDRNLTAGEIVEQLVRLRNLTPLPPDSKGKGEENAKNLTPRPPALKGKAEDEEKADRLTHIVVMGMGEPLANLENLLDALSVAGEKDGLGIGARHVTISTVGLPAKIEKLAQSGKQYHLAVSLHAPNDVLRNKIVPTNEKTGLPAILRAADTFFETTGRQVTYEYVVLGKMNDQPDHAVQLAKLLRGRKAHVNLIPWNDVTGLTYKRPTDDDLNGFIDTLRQSGVSVKVRKRKGSEIDAACGQLRRSNAADRP